MSGATTGPILSIAPLANWPGTSWLRRFTSSRASLADLSVLKRPRAGVEQIRQMSGEQLAATLNFFGVAEFPAVVYLTWLSNHSIHHRGQLSAYLRPMGAKVPAIYGPSGDEMWQQSDAASA